MIYGSINVSNGGSINVSNAGSTTASITSAGAITGTDLTLNGGLIIKNTQGLERFSITPNGTVTGYNSAQSVGWSAGHTTSNTSMEIRCGDGTNFQVGYINHTVQQSTVYHRTFVIDRTNGAKTSYYVNGVLQGSLDFTNITGPIYNGTGSDFVNGFVFGYVWCWRFIGGVYNIMVHNRALSANEVQQNYNAQRGRFGI